jgi:prepilin-type N-terminal cleavage/methylation domain-containing protein
MDNLNQVSPPAPTPLYRLLFRIQPRPASATSRTAFTLIELLVVIAIIALLMSILMPAPSVDEPQESWKTAAASLDLLATYYYHDYICPFTEGNHSCTPQTKDKQFLCVREGDSH